MREIVVQWNLEKQHWELIEVIEGIHHLRATAWTPNGLYYSIGDSGAALVKQALAQRISLRY